MFSRTLLLFSIMCSLLLVTNCSEDSNPASGANDKILIRNETLRDWSFLIYTKDDPNYMYPDNNVQGTVSANSDYTINVKGSTSSDLVIRTWPTGGTFANNGLSIVINSGDLVTIYTDGDYNKIKRE